MADVQLIKSQAGLQSRGFFMRRPGTMGPWLRAWYFPRWRHLLMQMVMWLVLGTSMVLAAMLDYHLRQGQIIDFSPTVTDGSLSFRLPATWKTWARKMRRMSPSMLRPIPPRALPAH